MSRNARDRRGLGLVLRLGAAWDWVLALAILSASPRVMEFLRFPPPADLFLFRVAAMPPLLFPLVYLVAAADPERRSWAVRLSVALRLAGGLVLGALALLHRPAGGHVYLGTAVADLCWGAGILALSRR
jgi:hypothetical protein